MEPVCHTRSGHCRAVEVARYTIGNTPLLALRLSTMETPGGLREVRAGEHDGQHQGPHGAAHPAAGVPDGQIRPGDTIAEATSGNTGIAFSAIGRALGHPVTVFMPDWMSHERMALISSFGASIVPVSRAQGGFLAASA